MPPRRSTRPGDYGSIPVSQASTPNFTEGNILYLPKFDDIESLVPGGMTSDEKGKFGHMVVIVDVAGRREVRVVVITTKIKKYCLQLKCDVVFQDDPETLVVEVLRGNPFKSETLSYVALESFPIPKNALVSLRGGRAEARLAKGQLEKLNQRIKDVAMEIEAQDARKVAPRATRAKAKNTEKNNKKKPVQKSGGRAAEKESGKAESTSTSRTHPAPPSQSRPITTPPPPPPLETPRSQPYAYTAAAADGRYNPRSPLIDTSARQPYASTESTLAEPYNTPVHLVETPRRQQTSYTRRTDEQYNPPPPLTLLPAHPQSIPARQQPTPARQQSIPAHQQSILASSNHRPANTAARPQRTRPTPQTPLGYTKSELYNGTYNSGPALENGINSHSLRAVPDDDHEDGSTLGGWVKLGVSALIIAGIIWMRRK